MSDVVAILNGDRGQNYPSKDKLQQSGIPFISAINIEQFKVSKKKLLYMSEKQYSMLRAGKLEKNDILYCIRGSLGKCGIFQMEQGAIASSLVIVRPYFKTLSTIKYLLSYLTSDFIRTEIYKYDNGTAQPNLAANDFSQFLIPLPPQSEQKRISETVETLLQLVETIDSDKIDLSNLIKQTKAKVLDLAIKGKLVPQDSNDEPADKLLEKIREEKEKLIKEGKLKRDKNETLIFKNSDDNSYYEQIDGETVCIYDDLPFEIPNSWRWCKINNIAKNVMYGLSNSAENSGNCRLLRITDIQNNMVNWNKVPYTNISNKEANTYQLNSGDIVFARTGATVGKSYLITKCPDNTVYASYLIRIHFYDNILSEYIYNFFNSNFYWDQITDKSSGIGQPNVNGTSLKELILPLAPLNEQKRIAIKIKSIFSQLDTMQEIFLQ